MINYIFRAMPLNRDSRTERFSKIIGRDCVCNTWEDSYESQKGLERLKIGKNRASKIITYPLYLFYLILFSLIKIKSRDRVICMELVTFIPVFIGSFWKGANIYLDIVDPIGQTKFRKLFFNKLFDYVEFYFLKKRHLNIVPNLNRIEYYHESLGLDTSLCKFIVIENVPSIEDVSYENNNIEGRYDIGYFGTLNESRGLKELINFIENSDLNLLIAGGGPMHEYIERKSLQLGRKKIEYIGSYGANKLGILYAKVDFSWSYYTDQIFLHKFASPNKYYEHLAFKVPIIINEYVPFSSNVEKMKTGVVIGDALTSYCFKEMERKILNYNYLKSNFNLWDLEYKNYKVNLELYEEQL